MHHQPPDPQADLHAARSVGEHEAAADVEAAPDLGVAAVLAEPQLDARAQRHPLADPPGVGGLQSRSQPRDAGVRLGEVAAGAKLWLRGALAKRKLLQMDGGVLSPTSAAALLGVNRQAVGQRRAAGRLLGVKGPRGYLYPAWQFTDRGMLPGLEDTLRALRGEDAWSILTFFLEPDAAAGNQRPLDLLRMGRLDAVARAAELYGEQAAV